MDSGDEIALSPTPCCAVAEPSRDATLLDRRQDPVESEPWAGFSEDDGEAHIYPCVTKENLEQTLSEFRLWIECALSDDPRLDIVLAINSSVWDESLVPRDSDDKQQS